MADGHNQERDVRSFVTYRMARAQAKLNAQASAVLRRVSDLSLTEWRVLSLVAVAQETTAAAIARDVQMDKAQISRAVKRLIAAGHLVSEMNDDDHRQSILRPTDSGAALFNRVVSVMQRRQEWLHEGIETDDLEVFASVLDRIEAASAKRDF